MRDLRPFNIEEKQEILDAFLPKKLSGKSEWDLDKIYRWEMRRPGNRYGNGDWITPLFPSTDWRKLVYHTIENGESFTEGSYRLSSKAVNDYYEKNNILKHYQAGRDDQVEFLVWQLSKAIPSCVMVAYRHFRQIAEVPKIHGIANGLIDQADKLRTDILAVQGKLHALRETIGKAQSIEKQLIDVDADRLTMPYFGRQKLGSDDDIIPQVFDYGHNLPFSKLYSMASQLFEEIWGSEPKQTLSWIGKFENNILPSINQISEFKKLGGSPSDTLEELFVIGLVSVFDSFAEVWMRQIPTSRFKTQRWKFTQTCFNLLVGNDDDKKTYGDDAWQKRLKRFLYRQI